MSLIGIFRERATLFTFDDIVAKNSKVTVLVTVGNPLRIVVCLMSMNHQWVPQPNGVFEEVLAVPPLFLQESGHSGGMKFSRGPC